MNTYGWYYMGTGHKRHVVKAAQLKAFPQQSAICGARVLSMLPPQARWLNDAEGLEGRQECLACRKSLDAETAVIKILSKR